MVAPSHVGAPLLHDDREIGHYTLDLANQGLREVRVSGKPLTSEAQLPRRPLSGISVNIGNLPLSASFE